MQISGVAPGQLQKGPSARLDAVERGNVLVVLADDYGTDQLGLYGIHNDPPSTPTIDSLAADGVRFMNAWSLPICSPTRAALLTGRYAGRTGVGWNVADHPTQPIVGLPLEELTIPEMLDVGTNGLYAHAAIGKWHLGSTAVVGGALAPNMHGFDHFSGSLDNLPDYYNWEKVTNGVAQQTTSYAMTDKVDDALAWMSTAPEPWFCYLALNAPHGPFHSPPSNLHSVDLSGAAPPGADPAPYFRAMVESMDTELGRLLEGLGAKRNRTTVMFMGDNGTTPAVLQAPFTADSGKETVRQGGVHVPLIISGPLVQVPGSTIQALVHVVDVFPTVAELAGVDLQMSLPRGTKIDGRSLLPFLSNPQHKPRRERIYTEIFFPNGPGAQLPLSPSGNDPVCQPDLGLLGPGSAQLSLCGAPLTFGNTVSLQITGAPADAAGFLFESLAFAPMPFGGGSVGTTPIFTTTPFVTDATGFVELPEVEMLKADFSVYMQAIIEDAGLSGGYAITNAIEAEFQPINIKALRGRRYKLILSYNGGPEQFFDLENDAFELNNLLEGSLNPVQQAVLDDMRAELDDYSAL